MKNTIKGTIKVNLSKVQKSEDEMLREFFESGGTVTQCKPYNPGSSIGTIKISKKVDRYSRGYASTSNRITENNRKSRAIKLNAQED